VSNLDGLALPFLNHRFPVLEGVLAADASHAFQIFHLRRKEKAANGGR